MTEFAFAKINLSLKIIGKRPDGYHEIESVMQRLSLHDTLLFTPRKKGIDFVCRAEGVPNDESNLCVKAAKAYLEAAGIREGVAIELVKAIPAGAGLGGGSADAAAVLRAMASLYPASLDLEKIALTLGADVPFCCSGTTSLCRGLGEKMTPVAFAGKEKLFALVAKGPSSLSTPAVYRAFDEREKEPGGETAPLLFAMEKGGADAIRAALFNDLESAAVALQPSIAALKSLMEAYGAKNARMTGSGSAVFALFEDREKAERCASLLGQDGFFSAVCSLL